MSHFSSANDAALGGATVLVAGLVEMILPGHTVRVVDGSAQVPLADGRIFYATDSIVGTLLAIDDLTDGTGDEAPALGLTFSCATDATAAELASAEMQGSPTRIYLAVVDQATGAPIDTPELLFDGLLDVPTLKVDQGKRSVEYEVTSNTEDFFLNDDGALLNGGFYKSIFPTALGLDFVSSVQQTIDWGQSSEDGVSR